MKRTLVLLGLSLVVLLGAVRCNKTDELTNPGDPNPPTDVTPDTPDSLALSRALPPLLANGTDQITIRATVVNTQGKGLAGVGVAFSTTHGTIEPFATTDASGIASTTLTSAASQTDLTAVITADAASAAAFALARTDAQGSTHASAQASSQPSSQVSTQASSQASAQASAQTLQGAHIILSRAPLGAEDLRQAVSMKEAGSQGSAEPAGEVAVRDVASVLMKGITLSLEANPATIPADGISESRVAAHIIETTSRIPLAGEDVFFGATQGSITGKVATDATGTATAILRGVPGQTVTRITAYYGKTLTAEAPVSFSPLTLDVQPASESLLADGLSRTDVVARLINQEGNPVAGARIDFSTSLGTIDSPVNTDAQGKAVAVLTADTTPGSAEIHVSFGGLLTRNVRVNFVAPAPATNMILEIDPSSLPANGTSVARIIARPLDASSNPVPDGTPVQFALLAGTGQIVAPLATTVDGIAEAQYVAGTETGTVEIGATSGNATASAPVLLQSLEAGELELALSEPSILADGLASALLSATATDLLGHPVAPGTAISFTTSLGQISEVTPTDASGKATARLRADRYLTGTARVTVSLGGIQKTIDARFTSDDAAHIEATRVDPPRIGVRGASDRETATITFEVRDRNGIPVDEDHAVDLAFAVRPVDQSTDATLYPARATTNEKGKVMVTVNSGIISGTVLVHASSTSLTSDPIRVAIHGDLPDPERFTIYFEKLNIAGLVYAGIQNTVTAKVGDQHGNPVPDSTVVWFSAGNGIVQGSAFTDGLGDAAVQSETSAPWPQIPGGTGLVPICAQTVSKAGGHIEICGNVMWSGPTIVEITEPVGGFSVPNGGSVGITFRVRDANFNPLTGGTRISVTSTGGALAGDTDFTLPDTQSREYTTFHVVLADDDVEKDKPAAVSITVRVTSQNGNRSDTLTGTVN